MSKCFAYLFFDTNGCESSTTRTNHHTTRG